MTHQELKLRFVSMGIAGPPFPQRNDDQDGHNILEKDHILRMYAVSERRLAEVASSLPSRSVHVGSVPVLTIGHYQRDGTAGCIRGRNKVNTVYILINIS